MQSLPLEVIDGGAMRDVHRVLHTNQSRRFLDLTPLMIMLVVEKKVLSSLALVKRINFILAKWGLVIYDPLIVSDSSGDRLARLVRAPTNLHESVPHSVVRAFRSGFVRHVIALYRDAIFVVVICFALFPSFYLDRPSSTSVSTRTSALINRDVIRCDVLPLADSSVPDASSSFAVHLSLS
ncbi:hypothetical protein BHE74_00000738 [Ensete ventricosum]|nr:hypothetical protein BHE74_00000738 [Ensete ventricosum]